MTVPADRVQVLKQESTAGGGDATDQSGFNSWDAINETEDALSAAGLFVQEQGGPADENAGIWRESGVLKVKDSGTPGGTNLIAATNVGTNTDFLLEAEPPTPANNYDLTRASGVVTQETWKRADTTLIKSTDYTYSLGKVATEVRKVFAANGSTILGQTTRTWSYSAGQPSYALVRNV